jgi:hypothetical protein
MTSKLAAVTTGEFVPTAYLVAKPASELGARRQLPTPFVELGLFLADPAWPQTVDKDSLAVTLPGRLICAFQPNPLIERHCDNPSKWATREALSLEPADRNPISLSATQTTNIVG